MCELACKPIRICHSSMKRGQSPLKIDQCHCFPWETGNATEVEVCGSVSGLSVPSALRANKTACTPAKYQNAWCNASSNVLAQAHRLLPWPHTILAAHPNSMVARWIGKQNSHCWLRPLSPHLDKMLWQHLLTTLCSEIYFVASRRPQSDQQSASNTPPLGAGLRLRYCWRRSEALVWPCMLAPTLESMEQASPLIQCRLVDIARLD